MAKASEAQKQATKKYIENNDRINVVFAKGTKERIKNLGFTPSNFIKTVVETELQKLEKMK